MEGETHGLVLLEDRDVVDVDVEGALTLAVDGRRRVVRPTLLRRRHRLDDDVVNLRWIKQEVRFRPR